jgi:OOP family OmpA-OmpF porin
MQGAGIDVTNMTSKGFGESQPIESNETEEGREANRRIEFRLLSPHPVRGDTTPTPAAVTGVTGQQEQAPEPAVQMQGPNLPQMQGPQLPDPKATPQMQGPQLPRISDTPNMAPLTIGVSEEFQTLDEREESLRVPVQTADENTPRPGPRPEDIADRAAAQDEAKPE